MIGRTFELIRDVVFDFIWMLTTIVAVMVVLDIIFFPELGRIPPLWQVLLMHSILKVSFNKVFNDIKNGST